MLHTNNLIIKHKAGLLNLAEELNNVQELVDEGGTNTCKRMPTTPAQPLGSADE